MVGTAQTIFDITLEYAKQREQFGVPIGSFQAIKHKFADMIVALERARATRLLRRAHDRRGRRRAARAPTSVAKAAAGDCQRLLAKEGIQIHGGIGYTWEHDMHLYVRRIKSGEPLFGTARDHRPASPTSSVSDVRQLGVGIQPDPVVRLSQQDARDQCSWLVRPDETAALGEGERYLCALGDLPRNEVAARVGQYLVSILKMDERLVPPLDIDVSGPEDSRDDLERILSIEARSRVAPGTSSGSLRRLAAQAANSPSG